MVTDGSEQVMEHANLGRITSATKWSDLSEFDGDYTWLKEGWLEASEAGNKKHIMSATTSAIGGWYLVNVWGFIELDGARYHARKLVIKRGDEVARCRAIYAWAGTLEA